MTEKRKEAQEWLRGFMREVNGQDNRATANPYYFELRYIDEDDQHHEVGHCRTIFFTSRAADQYVANNGYNLPESVYVYAQWGGRNPELKQLLENIGTLVGVPHERR